MAPPPKHQSVIIVKKVTHGHGGHHGGAWKVAYADFVTAMMAFFMVMWILGMDQKAKDSIASYFNNPIGYKQGYSSGSSPIATGQSPVRASSSGFPLLSRAKERADLDSTTAKIRKRMAAEGLASLAGQVDITYTKEGLRIELVEDPTGNMFFRMASAAPHPQLQAILSLIGQELAPLQNAVIVEGHTDAARYDNGLYSNWELSSDRANAARRVLEGAGISEKRVVEVRGYADRELRITDNPLDPRNRRISIMLPFVSKAPLIVADAGDAASHVPTTDSVTEPSLARVSPAQLLRSDDGVRTSVRR